jgi:hypothetical protein
MAVPQTQSMTFLDLYMEHTKNYESPTSFWKWSAFTAIGAVLRDNCYRQLGDNRIYPNIYTLILANSAVHRKGAPVKMCEELVKRAKNTKVISGRASIQGILDELARGETDKSTGKMLSGGSALFSASELSAGIVGDPEAIKILTDIYEFKEEYVSRLRGSGVFRIKNICFSIMAASNEELLRDVYDNAAVNGGLLGRTFVVKPNEFRPGNSLFSIEDRPTSLDILAEMLAKMSRLAGEFQFTPAAQEIYNAWYYPFRKSYEHKSDRSGISGRLHTSILKLSMIIAANYTNALIVDECHMTQAIKEGTDLLPNYGSFIMSSGKSTIGEAAALLIEDIWNSQYRKISKAEFLGRYVHTFDHELCDKMLMTLQQAELIKMVLIDGNREAYEMTSKGISKFNLKEKQ